MDIRREVLVPLTLMALLLATCIQDKAHLMHLPIHISRRQGQLVLNLSTRPFPLHHLIPMHCQALHPSSISIVASHASSAPIAIVPSGSSVCTIEYNQSPKLEEKE